MSHELETRIITTRALRRLDRRLKRKQPIKGYRKSTTFKGRGGAWFMIVLCALCLAFCIYLLIAAPFEGDKIWGYVMFSVAAILFFIMLRRSISMLQSKIIVGPEMLVLDGAEEITPKRRLWHALMGGLYITDLIVEIPWEDVARLSSDEAELTVDTKSGRRFIMNLSYFDIRVRSEISKYHKIED